MRPLRSPGGGGRGRGRGAGLRTPTCRWGLGAPVTKREVAVEAGVPAVGHLVSHFGQPQGQPGKARGQPGAGSCRSFCLLFNGDVLRKPLLLGLRPVRSWWECPRRRPGLSDFPSVSTRLQPPCETLSPTPLSFPASQACLPCFTGTLPSGIGLPVRVRSRAAKGSGDEPMKCPVEPRFVSM